MFHRIIVACGLSIVLIGMSAAPQSAAQQAKKKGSAQKKSAVEPKLDDVTNMSLEVEALQALRAFEPTDSQLKELLSIAKTSAGKPRARTPAKVSAAYRETLQQLHDSLIENDDDRIDQLETKLDDLTEKESPEVDDEFETTAAARNQAASALKALELKQLLAYVTDQGDSLSDPREAIADALDEGKSKTGDEWKELRDETADDLASVLAGANAKKVADAERAVKELLDKWHGKNVVAEELDKDVKQLLGGQLPTDLLRNAFEAHLASSLSNPRMAAAIEARLAATK